MGYWVKGLLTSLFLVLVCFALWFLWGRNTGPERLEAPIDSIKRLETTGAPDFELPGFDGKKLRLSSFKGKVVILNFWATWCAPCVTEFPSMVRMARSLGDKIVLITVSADEKKEDVHNFVKTFKGNLPNIVYLWDPSTGTAREFGTTKLPETYIFKSDLKLAKKIVNSLEWDKPEVLKYLREL